MIIYKDSIKYIVKSLTSSQKEAYEAKYNSLMEQTQGMMDDFDQTNDSLRDIMFKNAIAVKNYEQKYDNDTISATVKGMVRGTIETMNFDYTIKPRPIIEKETKFRMLAGGGINLINTNPVFNVNAGFQNRKGNVLIFSYGKDFLSANYSFSLFNIKGDKE